MELQNEAASRRVESVLVQSPPRTVHRGQVAAEFQRWPTSGVELRPLQVQEQTHVVRTAGHTPRSDNDKDFWVYFATRKGRGLKC